MSSSKNVDRKIGSAESLISARDKEVTSAIHNDSSFALIVAFSEDDIVLFSRTSLYSVDADLYAAVVESAEYRGIICPGASNNIVISFVSSLVSNNLKRQCK